MFCPFCRRDETRVIDSRSSAANSIRRRRECLNCERRFTTYEKIEQVPLRVAKRNGTGEPFDRAKLRTGIEKACSKRPVSAAEIDRLIAEVEAEMVEEFPREVPSRILGERVLDCLRELDQVAAMRYASVLREFDDANAFTEEARNLTLPAR